MSCAPRIVSISEIVKEESILEQILLQCDVSVVVGVELEKGGNYFPKFIMDLCECKTPIEAYEFAKECSKTNVNMYKMATYLKEINWKPFIIFRILNINGKDELVTRKINLTNGCLPNSLIFVDGFIGIGFKKSNMGPMNLFVHYSSDNLNQYFIDYDILEFRRKKGNKCYYKGQLSLGASKLRVCPEEFICCICKSKHSIGFDVHCDCGYGPHYASEECITSHIKKNFLSCTTFRKLRCPQCSKFIHPDVVLNFPQNNLVKNYMALIVKATNADLLKTKVRYPIPFANVQSLTIDTISCCFERDLQFNPNDLIFICINNHRAQPGVIEEKLRENPNVRCPLCNLEITDIQHLLKKQMSRKPSYSAV